MAQNYPIIMKYLIIIGLAVLAVLVPFAVLKILLGLVAIIVFALTLKKFSALLITLGIIFFVIPSIGVTAFRFVLPSIDQWLRIPNLWQFDRSLGDWFSPWEYSYTPSIPTPPDQWRDIATDYSYSARDGLFLFLPNAGVDHSDSLTIEGVNLEISFDPSFSGIQYPDAMNLSRRTQGIALNMPNWKDTRFQVVVGTAKGLKSIAINGTVLLMTGHCVSEEVRVNVVTGTIQGSIDANLIDVRSTTLSQSGEIVAQTVRFSGVTIALRTELKNAQSISVHGITIGGSIKYLDTWNGTRHLEVSGTTGVLNLQQPVGNQGILDINSQGRIAINRSTY
jgi:hypothetical protein